MSSVALARARRRRGADFAARAPQPQVTASVAAVATALLLRAAAAAATAVPPPVFVIPGFACSRLSANLANHPQPHWFCAKNAHNEAIWLAPTRFAPLERDCWAGILKPVWDKTKRLAHDAPGVTMIPNGGTDGCRYLVSGGSEPYAGPLFDKLMDMGLEDGTTLQAFTYDWRLAPQQHALNYSQGGTNYFPTLKTSIEAQGRPVILLGHSMGNSMIQYFLQRIVSPAWKAAHVLRYIAVSSPVQGAADMARTVISGDNGNFAVGNVTLLPNPFVQAVMTSFPGAWSLIPTPGTNMADVPGGGAMDTGKVDIYKLAGGDTMVSMFEGTADSRAVLAMDPGVPVSCVYSHTGSQSTVVKMAWPTPNMTVTQPVILMGPGDSTVPQSSLEACSAWKSADDTQVVDGVKHAQFLAQDKSISVLASIIAAEGEKAAKAAGQHPQ